MKILVATDAWRPQVNGVVRTYERLCRDVMAHGSELAFLTPGDFATVPCPTYPRIRLSVPGYRRCVERIRSIAPDAIHIATEGPVGWMTRAYCRNRGLPFTTSFHTRFPEYLYSRFGICETWTYALLRRFHNAGAGMMVATRSLAGDLQRRGFGKILPWTRGVDTALFRPRDVRRFGSAPVFLYVGRVAIEKNIEAFLGLNLPGRKVVVGEGPARAALQHRFPDVTFAGEQTGEALAECYASADVFVFPSRTDTFGIVMLEAMASGVPVAALPVTGPVDVVRPRQSGVLWEDLAVAALAALDLDKSQVRACALEYSWDRAARMFLDNIEAAGRDATAYALPKRRDVSRRTSARGVTAAGTRDATTAHLITNDRR